MKNDLKSWYAGLTDEEKRELWKRCARQVEQAHREQFREAFPTIEECETYFDGRISEKSDLARMRSFMVSFPEIAKAFVRRDEDLDNPPMTNEQLDRMWEDFKRRQR